MAIRVVDCQELPFPTTGSNNIYTKLDGFSSSVDVENRAVHFDGDVIYLVWW